MPWQAFGRQGRLSQFLGAGSAWPIFRAKNFALPRGELLPNGHNSLRIDVQHLVFLLRRQAQLAQYGQHVGEHVYRCLAHKEPPGGPGECGVSVGRGPKTRIRQSPAVQTAVTRPRPAASWPRRTIRRGRHEDRGPVRFPCIDSETRFAAVPGRWASSGFAVRQASASSSDSAARRSRVRIPLCRRFTHDSVTPNASPISRNVSSSA